MLAGEDLFKDLTLKSIGFINHAILANDKASVFEKWSIVVRLFCAKTRVEPLLFPRRECEKSVWFQNTINVFDGCSFILYL